MKYALAAFVFILALGLTMKSVATEAELCTTEKKENCVQPKAHKSAHAKSEEKENLPEKMNSLFPEPQKNPMQSDRPTTVKLSSPKFLSKISGAETKLDWEAVEGATHYHVQVATDPNFKWLVANDHWVKTNSFEAKNLEAGQKYFWRVAAVKSDNDSMYTKSLFVSSVFETTAK
jgi:hypothetical protein